MNHPFKSLAKLSGVGKFSFKSEAVWILIFNLFLPAVGVLLLFILWLSR